MAVYKTVAGDTWDKIAKKVYGDEMLFPHLLTQNPTLLHIFVFDAGEEVLYDEIQPETIETAPAWRR